jgi:hypothetical protein
MAYSNIEHFTHTLFCNFRGSGLTSKVDNIKRELLILLGDANQDSVIRFANEELPRGWNYMIENTPVEPIIDKVNHPSHYGGDNPYEVIKVLEVWLSRDELIGFLKGNIIKYTARAGKKNQYERTQDHAKSKWYEDYLNDFLRRCPDVNKLENV